MPAKRKTADKAQKVKTPIRKALSRGSHKGPAPKSSSKRVLDGEVVPKASGRSSKPHNKLVQAIRSLRIKGQKLLRAQRRISQAKREECYRKVASLPLAKQQSFWQAVIAFLKKGAAKTMSTCREFYEQHRNSLMWALAGLALGWLTEIVLTVSVPFWGHVRVVHWAFKWMLAAAGWGWGIGADHDYRMKRTPAAAFA